MNAAISEDQREISQVRDDDPTETPETGFGVAASQKRPRMAVPLVSDDQQLHQPPFEPTDRGVDRKVLKKNIVPGTPVHHPAHKEDADASDDAEQKAEKAEEQPTS